MRKTIAFLTMAVMTLTLCLSSTFISFAAEKPEVRTSAQPCLHGMPLWQAAKAGWLKDAPFTDKFMLFASGAPQVEALAADQWDAGAMGAIPTMLASMRYGFKLIGVSNDESETNDLWVRPDSPLLKSKGANPKFPEIYGSAADWKGKKVLATTVSTGHYVLTATLNVLGLKDSDVAIVHMEQGQAVTAFNAGEGDILQLWAPFSYVAEAKGWIKVSSGARAGVVVMGGIGVRKDFAEQHPELVVEWLDMYMKGVEMMKNNPKESVGPLLSYFTDYCGLELTKEQVEMEFKYRPLYDINEQIAALDDPTKVAAWMNGVANFLLSQGRIKQKEYDRYVKANYNIDSSFMKKLAERRAKAQ